MSPDGTGLINSHDRLTGSAGESGADATKFAEAENQWRERLHRLPNAVRQELVARQLRSHLPDRPIRVLDVGCGQGTQALRLAELGHHVTGLDHSPTMLADFAQALAAKPPQVQARVRLVHGEVEQLDIRVTRESFDLVLCHGVLMYLADPAQALEAMARALAPGAMLSLLVRNADAVALHLGLRSEWDAALAALNTTRYVNRLGIEARAHRLRDLSSDLARLDLNLRHWYGVVTFAEFAAMEAPVPAKAEFSQIVACEEQVGRRDPYRRIAALLHLIACRNDVAGGGRRGLRD